MPKPRKDKDPIEKYYRFVEPVDPNAEDVCYIQIKRGRFAGVVYQYGAVRFNEDGQGGCHCEYECMIIDNPKNIDPNDKKFIKLVGKILDHCFNEQSENGEIDVETISSETE